MDLVQLFRALGRRWYAVLAGLIILAIAGVLAFRFVPVTYDARASLLLIPPNKTVVETNGNPFLNLGGLDVVAGVLSLSLTDSTTVAKIAPPTSKTTYTVAPDQSIPGSVLDIGVSSRTAKQALDTLGTIEELATTRLHELQDEVNAPQSSQARVMVITNNNKATPNYSSLSRALIVVVAAGLVLTFLLTIALDAIIRRRSDRKAARQPAHATEPDDQPGADDKPAESSREARKRVTAVKRRRPAAEPATEEPSPQTSSQPPSETHADDLDDDEETDVETLVGYHGRPR